jgi:divalent metal cation (Fe/Co/Zn/Cd) transporter
LSVSGLRQHKFKLLRKVNTLSCVELQRLTFVDCRTDVIFNTLTLLFPAIGHKWNIWWLDPLGAGLLSLFIIFDWGETAFDNVIRLSGSAVDFRVEKKLIYLAWRFSPVIDGFKNIKAYHAGDGVWVEIDILLDPKCSLMKAHDISETLQYCMEGLPEVDRAFVTVDCERKMHLLFAYAYLIVL